MEEDELNEFDGAVEEIDVTEGVDEMTGVTGVAEEDIGGAPAPAVEEEEEKEAAAEAVEEEDDETETVTDDDTTGEAPLLLDWIEIDAAAEEEDGTPAPAVELELE